MYEDGEDGERDGKSGEAIAIIAKLRKKRGSSGGEADSGDDAETEESGSASQEAELSATEDIGRILAGRTLKEREVSDLRDALRRFVQNCGEGEE
jgi:hypothetical protein